MKIVDYPMQCCGMVQVKGVGVIGCDWLNPDTGVTLTVEKQWDNLFSAIEDHQRTFGRNCAMMVLSSEQPNARKQAENRGWNCIQEYWNPNSDNQNYIYTKILFDKGEKDHVEQVKILKKNRAENGVRWEYSFPEYSVLCSKENKSALELYKERQEKK